MQLCVQGLLLREQGYRCDEGIISYAETRERRVVPLDESLIARTLAYVEQLRAAADLDEPPAPLVDSPKCPRCSLVGICLPDETNLLANRSERVPRRLVPRDSAARPLYVTEQGAYVGMRSGGVEVRRQRESIGAARLIDVSQINVTGNVQLSTQLLRECFRREVPVMWFSFGLVLRHRRRSSVQARRATTTPGRHCPPGRASGRQGLRRRKDSKLAAPCSAGTVATATRRRSPA